MINVTVKTQCRADYNNAFNAIIGDSKNTMEFDSFNWLITGKMTESDYNDMIDTLTHTMPGYPITINADDTTIIISYDYDEDDNDYITVNGTRQ